MAGTACIALMSAFAAPAMAQQVTSKTVSSKHFDIILHNDYTTVYSDIKSGAEKDLLALNPKVESGYYMLGTVALNDDDGAISNAKKNYDDDDDTPVGDMMPSYDYLPLAITLKPKPGHESLLAKPIRWVKVWDDAGSGGRYDGTFFRAVCPSNYAALGGVIAAQREAGSSDFPSFRCVSTSILTDAAWEADPVWTDKKSDADDNGSLFRVSTAGASSQKNSLLVAPIVATASDDDGYRAPPASLGRPMLLKLELEDKPTSKVEAKATTTTEAGDAEVPYETDRRGLPRFTADYQAQFDGFVDNETTIVHSVPWQYVDDPKKSRLEQWAEDTQYEMVEKVSWEKVDSLDTIGPNCRNTSQLTEFTLSESLTTGSETNWNNTVGGEIGVTAEGSFKPLGVGGTLAVSASVNYSHEFGGNDTRSLQLTQGSTFPRRMGAFAAYFKRVSEYSLYRLENGQRNLLKEGANGVFEHGFAEAIYFPEGRTDDNPCISTTPAPTTTTAAVDAQGMTEFMKAERDFDTEEVILSSDDGKGEFHLLDAGHSLKKGTKHVSRSGDHYLMFEPGGGDLRVYAFELGGDYVVWSMREQIARTGHVDKVVYQRDGNLAAYDTEGNYMWSALHETQPNGTELHLRDDGELQIVHPDGTIAWSSTGNIEPGTD